MRFEGEVAVIEVADQQALSLEVPAEARAQAMDQRFELGFGRRLDPIKAQSIIGRNFAAVVTRPTLASGNGFSNVNGVSSWCADAYGSPNRTAI